MLKFSTDVKGVPSRKDWFSGTLGIMELVSNLVVSPSKSASNEKGSLGKQMTSPMKNPISKGAGQKMKSPVARPSSAQKNKCVEMKSPNKRSQQQTPGKSGDRPELHISPGPNPLLPNANNENVPVTLKTIGELVDYLKGHSKAVIYVPHKKSSELVPAFVLGTPIGDDDSVVCRMGQFQQAIEKKCKMSDIVVLNELPKNVQMKLYERVEDTYSDRIEGRRCDFLGWISKVVETPLPQNQSRKQIVNRLRIKPEGSTNVEELPIFRCSLVVDHAVSNLLNKRNNKSIGSPTKSMRKTAKRVVEDAIEITEPVQHSKISPPKRKATKSVTDDRPEATQSAKRGPGRPRRSLNPLSPPPEPISNEKPSLKGNSKEIVKTAEKKVATKRTRNKTRSSYLQRDDDNENLLRLSESSNEAFGVSEKSEKPLVNSGKNANISKMFLGQMFIVLNAGETEGPNEFLSVEQIEIFIRQCGGQILEQTASCFSKAAKITLVTQRPNKLFKYLFAIAAGIPCVSYGWIQACLDAKRDVPKTPFLLEAGRDKDGKVYRQRPPFQPIFSGKKFFIAAGCKVFFMIWHKLLTAAGAEPVPSLTSEPVKNLRATVSNTTNLTSMEDEGDVVKTCDFVLAETDDTCFPSFTICNAIKEHNVRFVKTKWILQCILEGKMIDPVSFV